MPACFSMLLSVPIGISRTGCGTVTRPGFTGCLNCLWLPTCATSYQPSCFKRCMTSRLDIRNDTHFLHTRQVGIYRSDRREPSAHWRRGRRAFCAKSTLGYLGYPLTLDRNRWHFLVECRGER